MRGWLAQSPRALGGVQAGSGRSAESQDQGRKRASIRDSIRMSSGRAINHRISSSRGERVTGRAGQVETANGNLNRAPGNPIGYELESIWAPDGELAYRRARSSSISVAWLASLAARSASLVPVAATPRR